MSGHQSRLKVFLGVFAFALSVICASGQIIVQVKPAFRQYVAHEDVTVEVSVTNRAGKGLTFQGSKRLNWLELHVTNQEGRVLVPIDRNHVFPSVKIAAGQTMTRQVLLSDFFDLTRYGSYQVYAVVRLPGVDDEGFSSRTEKFVVTTGRKLFSQKIGLGNDGSDRQFEVMTFNGPEKSKLYVKISRFDGNQVLSCEPVGDYVGYFKPQASLDQKNNLNLLFLTTPVIYSHVVVTPSGKMIKRAYHKEGAFGKPRLLAFGNGEVKVAGSVPYDPKKAREARTRETKLSDRPDLY